MYPDYHQLSRLTERSLAADRRPLPRANEIRLRVKRATTPKAA